MKSYQIHFLYKGIELELRKINNNEDINNLRHEVMEIQAKKRRLWMNYEKNLLL